MLAVCRTRKVFAPNIFHLREAQNQGHPRLGGLESQIINAKANRFLQIVDENSAVLNIPNEIPIPIEADHRSMCKFSSNKTEKYRMVADCLKELVDDALHEPRSC